MWPYKYSIANNWRRWGERDQLKSLEHQVWGLRKANEIPRHANAFFAQAELDRRFTAEAVYRLASGHLRGRTDLQGIEDYPRQAIGGHLLL